MPSTALPAPPALAAATAALRRTIVIALIAFLTLVDLFATQAILPSLAKAYGVTPAAMGLAVNASTLGMAVASLAIAFLSRRLDRRRGIVVALAALSVPTLLLAAAPDLPTFAGLRIAQGLLMATAFTLTLTYLGERCSARMTAGAFAAYITGNVASNLFGRLLSAAVADHYGLAANFLAFAALNLLGALLVQLTLQRSRPAAATEAGPTVLGALALHLSNPGLRAAFAIGFCILFAFIGTFTYVNFVLVRPPLGLGMMSLGLVYFVFLPSIFTTLGAGAAVAWAGTRGAFLAAIGIALSGLPLLLAPAVLPVIVGLGLVAVGTFLAQAITTGFVGRAATADRGAASGIYLASYFLGGLLGTAVLGLLFDRFGWSACVAGIAASLLAAALLGLRLKLPPAE